MIKKAIFVLVIVSTLTLSASSAELLTYLLDEGSTVMGPDYVTENLTGTFTWYYSGGNASFHTTDLYFQSDSFTFVLNQTPYNDLDSSLFPDGTCYFGEIVDTTGLPLQTVEISSAPLNPGSYIGSIYSPTHLEFPYVNIFNHEGGSGIGQINMSATLVPEPATLFLLGLGAVILRKCKK